MLEFQCLHINQPCFLSFLFSARSISRSRVIVNAPMLRLYSHAFFGFCVGSVLLIFRLFFGCEFLGSRLLVASRVVLRTRHRAKLSAFISADGPGNEVACPRPHPRPTTRSTAGSGMKEPGNEVVGKRLPTVHTKRKHKHIRSHFGCILSRSFFFLSFFYVSFILSVSFLLLEKKVHWKLDKNVLAGRGGCCKYWTNQKREGKY